MKKVLLAFTLLISFGAYAQPEGRVFTVSNQTYANLTSSTVIVDTLWDDFTAKVPLGFTFHLFGENIDTVFFDGTDGMDNNLGADMQFRLDTITNMIGLNGVDLIDRSSDNIHNFSPVSYKTITQSSKKITKIEWKNAGFFSDNDTAYNDYINFQYWFYENNSDFEIHFGSHSINSDYGTIFNNFRPFFGFFKNFDPVNVVFDTCYFVNSINPARVDSISSDSMLLADSLGIDGQWPANGTVFKFSKPTVGITGVQLNDYASVFPTAFVDQLFINISRNDFEGDLYLIDMSGKIVARQKISFGNNTLQTSSLASGTYIINIKSKEESVFYKVIKN